MGRSNVRLIGGISAHTVLGILELADQAKSLSVAKVGESDRPALRYPQDFPGARPTVRACRDCGCTEDRACVDENGPCGWASHSVCTRCQGIRDAKLIEREGEDVAGTLIEIEAAHEEAVSAQIEAAQAADAKGADYPFEDAPRPARPVGNAAKVVTVLKPMRSGQTAAQERLSRLPLVSPGKAGQRPLPPDPIEQRRQRLNRAIAWLRDERGMGVRVVDREAEVRQYQVGNCGVHMFAEAVIDFAIEAGMPIDG